MNAAATPAAEATAVAPAVAPAVAAPVEPLVLPLTVLLWKLRAENGWRNRDYLKYGQTIAKKLQRLRKSAGVSVPNNSKGRQSGPQHPVGNTKEQLQVLLFEVELAYARLLDTQESIGIVASGEKAARDSTASQLRKALRRHAKVGSAAVARMAAAANAFADKTTQLEASAYCHFARGLCESTLRLYSNAAKSLQAALAGYTQVRMLFPANTDGTAAVAEAISLTEKELRQAAFGAASSGAPLTALETDGAAAAEHPSMQSVPFSWKGCEVSAPLELLEATRLSQPLEISRSTIQLTKVADQGDGWDSREAKQAVLDCKQQAATVENGLEGLRGFVLDESTAAAQGALLALESHLRELLACISAEIAAVTIAHAVCFRSEIPAGFAVQTVDAFTRTLRGLAQSQAPPGLPTELRAKVSKFNAYVKGHLQPFLQLGQTLRQLFVADYLTHTQPLRAYALYRVVVQQKETLSDEVWDFPDSPIWKDSPLHRVAYGAKMMAAALAAADVKILQQRALAHHLRRALGHNPIACDEHAVEALAEKAKEWVPELKIASVPLPPIVPNLAGELINDQDDKSGGGGALSDDEVFHDFEEEDEERDLGGHDSKSRLSSLAAWLAR